jgi:hypothetical protein
MSPRALVCAPEDLIDLETTRTKFDDPIRRGMFAPIARLLGCDADDRIPAFRDERSQLDVDQLRVRLSGPPVTSRHDGVVVP